MIVVLLHCAAISEALQCNTVFSAFATNLKNFKKLFKLFATFLAARGLVRFAVSSKTF